nr:hypothetical protein CFP56_40130 [Quercus suber]
MPFISSPIKPSWKEATVDTLLDFSSQGWRHDLLSFLFSPRDKELIQSIPLCGKPVEDALVWPFTPTGSYTVKSGYRFLHKSRSLDIREYHSDENKLWKKVTVVTTVMRNQRMCFMRFGRAHPFLRLGLSLVHGKVWILVRVFQASKIWWKQLLRKGRT